MPQYRECKSVAVYMSMPTGELQTERLVKHALATSKTVYIPYIYKPRNAPDGAPSSIMDMLLLQDEADYAALKPDRWGIPSLDESTVAARPNCFGGQGLTHGHQVGMTGLGLDLVLVPGLLFDGRLNRLGHGKGYYDNFIARCHAEAATFKETESKPYLGTLILAFPLPNAMLDQ